MSTGPRPVADLAVNDPTGPHDDQRRHDLVSHVGVEIAEPLTAALERIHVLTATGKIDRAGLRALRDEVEQARQAGMIGQQLTRFASGRVRQSHEVLQLEEVLKSVLSLRTLENPPEVGAVVTKRYRIWPKLMLADTTKVQ